MELVQYMSLTNKVIIKPKTHNTNVNKEQNIPYESRGNDIGNSVKSIKLTQALAS